MSTQSVFSDEFTHNLLNTAPIVQTILKYLNARDLNSSARVCQFWAHCASKLKSKRRTRAWTCLVDTADQKWDSTFSVLFEDTNTFFQDLYTEPDVVFMVCNTDLLNARLARDTGSSSLHNQSKARLVYKEYVRSLLPAKCHLVCVGSVGIVGTDRDLKVIHEVESSAAVAFLCLPKYSGFAVDICDDIEGKEEGMDSDNSDVDTAEVLAKQSIAKDVQHFVQKLLSEGHPPCKLMLSFIAVFLTPRSVGFDVMKKLPGSLIAGAFIDEIMPKIQERDPLIQLTSISGEHVQVASIVISQDINTPETAEVCIKRLKQYGLPEENSFAFMFACLGRGEGLYGEPNVESSLFKRSFPNTPLIGLFGNGEIGFEHCSKEQSCGDAPSRKLPKSSSQLYHANTTILVLVSIS